MFAEEIKIFKFILSEALTYYHTLNISKLVKQCQCNIIYCTKESRDE